MNVMQWFTSFNIFNRKSVEETDNEEHYEPLDDDKPSLGYRDHKGVWRDLPMNKEIKIDREGNVFFKEHNKWIIQHDVTGIDFVK